MNWSIKEVVKVLLIVAVLFGGTLPGAKAVWAQEKGSNLAQQIQGSWILVSIVNEQGGKKIDLYGPGPRGFMVLTPDGRFSMIIMKASLPKFASNNRLKGTIEENQAVVQGSHCYYGTYAVVSEQEHAVNLHMEASTFPNWDGQDQKRVITVKGDEISFSNPYSTVGGVNYSVWKRAK